MNKNGDICQKVWYVYKWKIIRYYPLERKVYFMTNFNHYINALDHFIDLSAKDATSNIAKSHGIIGLTRLIICMERLGLDASDVCFIALPDYTYTRNSLRWNSGFPYGCIISINQSVPFIPIDFRPNCCGVIFAQIPNQDFNILSIRNTYYELMNSYNDIDSTDFNRRNHFFGLYHSEENDTYYFLIHGSFSFAKKQLYSEKNDALLSNTSSFNILNMPFHFLLDKDAKSYYKKYLYYEKMTMHYRELILKELFPNAQILFHRTHEGFMDMGTILLGAYADTIPFNCPIMLAPEANLPLTSINNPVKISISRKLYCAPHGGGYALSSVTNVKKLSELQNEFLVTYTNYSQMLTNNIIDMPFYYRTDSADKWCNQYKKGKIITNLKPIFNLKI